MGLELAAYDRNRYIDVGDFLNTGDPCARFYTGLSRLQNHQVLILGSDPGLSRDLYLAALATPNRLIAGRGGRITSIRFEPVAEAEAEAFALAGDPEGIPVACLCRFEHGRQDVVYTTVFDRRRTAELASALRVGWPLVLNAARQKSSPDKLGEEAMSWALSRVSSLASIVLSGDRRIVEMNAAARNMVQAGTLFVADAENRLEAAHRSGAEKLRGAMRQILDGSANSLTLLLEARPNRATPASEKETDRPLSAPVTLSRFTTESSESPLVVLTLPLPPDQTQIDRLARLRGLTPTEARVAALLQQGLTNREVAEKTGCSEETAKTYSKRVLSKLNVTRSGLAQVLTWQASGASA